LRIFQEGEDADLWGVDGKARERAFCGDIFDRLLLYAALAAADSYLPPQVISTSEGDVIRP
jgi:hypothetical protein